MSEIYISGHRNPDMDSVCAAYGYAQLKNAVDPENRYVPVRCGGLNDSTKAQFERLGVVPPAYLKDVRARVSSVTRMSSSMLQLADPINKLVTLYGQSASPSVVPVMEGETYKGLLSIDEINGFILRENSGKRPVYHFLTDNFPKVLKGRFLKRGGPNAFDASIVVGAMRYNVFCRHLEALSPTKPLLVVGDREDHIKKAIDRQIPAIILTGLEEGLTANVDFDRYDGTVFVSEFDTAETIRLLRLSVPVEELISEDSPVIPYDCLFDEAKDILADSEFRGLPVFDGRDWKGFVTRRCFLERPKAKVIMVDHNEPEQSIPGIDEADILEIIDHHRLDAPKTRTPIYIDCEPLGSTCTIVYSQFLRAGRHVDEATARVLLSGLVSDTVILKSPTTTESDRKAAADLCRLGHIENLHSFGELLFSSGAVLGGDNPRKMIEGDFKKYREAGVKFGIGQCEVTTLSNVDEFRDLYLSTLEDVRIAYGLDWAMFLITDVIKENSVLLTTPRPGAERKLAYTKDGKGKFLLPGVLSRKKQLLPEIVRVLEE